MSLTDKGPSRRPGLASHFRVLHQTTSLVIRHIQHLDRNPGARTSHPSTRRTRSRQALSTGSTGDRKVCWPCVCTVSMAASPSGGDVDMVSRCLLPESSAVSNAGGFGSIGTTPTPMTPRVFVQLIEVSSRFFRHGNHCDPVPFMPPHATMYDPAASDEC